MLTLFTEPSLSKRYKGYKFVKNAAKFVLRRPVLAYSGHFAVMRSLHHGLKQLNVEFNYNPKRPAEVGDHVHVLGGIKALKMAIELRKQNKVKYLSAGPNVFHDAYESDRLITAKEIETYLCTAVWVFEFLGLQVEECRDKLRIWPAGVDTDYWSPQNKTPGKTKDCLLYIKNYPDEVLIEEIKRICSLAGCSVSVIQYGSYRKEEYLDSLRKVDCMIMVGTTESQCLAQFEAWSVNVPVVCFVRDQYEYKGRTYNASSSPYLNPQMGVFFRNTQELASILNDKQVFTLNPRKQVVEQHTDKLSSLDFLKKINYRYDS